MHFRYIAEAAALDAFLWMLGALPPKQASILGGKVMETLAPYHKKDKRAARHLELAFPEKSPAERAEIRRLMWRHLGMVIGEYPHLKKFYKGHKDFTVDITGLEHVQNLPDGAVAFISAHVGNWEILPLVAQKAGSGFTSAYRPPDNPLVAERLEALRLFGDVVPTGFSKSRGGVKGMAETLRDGGRVGFLIDQRHSRGTPLRLFGMKAESTTMAIDMALRYDATVVLGRVIRRGPCDFLVEILPPRQLPKDGDAATIMQGYYDLFETWIREHPEQWLWMHRRWGKRV